MTCSRSVRARGPSRRWWLLGSAAAVIALGVVGLRLADGEDDPDESAAPAVAFELPGADASMQMCLPVTDFVPDPAAQAFAGTVTAVDGTTVTFTVDRWYTGTSEQAAVVNLTGGTDVSVALDGVEFVVDERYLVTAFDGAVLICGVSAPATPELEALYEQWYGS